jgi:uncharacterized protein YqgC (DUF456 family)
MPFGPNPYSTLQALGVLLVLIGLVGVFLPILPGLLTIWLGALVWAIGDRFERMDWPALFGMGVLMVVGWGANWLMTGYFTRRGSASWKTVAGAVVGGLIGGVLLSVLPLIGSVLGAVIGGVVGVILVELLRARRMGPALRASRDYLVGCALGQMVELLFALLMIALFAWRATS